MPVQQSIRLPSYRLHKASGQAVVTLSGRDVDLGPFGSPESKQLDERRIAEWLANGRRAAVPARGGDLTVGEPVLAFALHAKGCDDKATDEGTIRPGLRRWVRLYGDAPLTEFGPLGLKAVRQGMLAETRTNKRGETSRLARPSINRMVQWIKTCVRWGVAEETVPSSVLHGLGAAAGLRRGRSEAREHDPIPFDEIRAAGKAGRMGDELMAIVAGGARGRVDLSPTKEHEAIARSAQPKDDPDTPLPEQALSFRVMLDGMDRHDKLFTPPPARRPDDVQRPGDGGPGAGAGRCAGGWVGEGGVGAGSAGRGCSGAGIGGTGGGAGGFTPTGRGRWDPDRRVGRLRTRLGGCERGVGPLVGGAERRARGRGRSARWIKCRA